MKRALGLIVLGVTVTVTAQEGQISEETLLQRVSEICKDYNLFLRLPEDARERVLEGGVPPEWVTETLERLVRKNLPVLEQMFIEETRILFSRPSSEYKDMCDKVTSSILILGKVSGSNTLALLRECVSFKNYMVRDAAVASYIAIEGGDSVPFLQEIIAKKLDANARLAQRFRRIISDLKKEGRDGDVEKFHVFLLEQLQTEQDWSSVEQLDKALCATLDDYPQSIQRKQAIQRMQVSVGDWNRERYQTLQTDVAKTPADKRTDLSKRFKLAPAPQ